MQQFKEDQALNRVVRCTPHGFKPEADLRHAELIVDQLGLGDCKTVSAAGVDFDVECAVWREEPEEEEFPLAEATHFRAIGARCNYLQPDRPDIQYAVKEAVAALCRDRLHAPGRC